MSWLKTSLALWRRRLAYRQSRLAAARVAKQPVRVAKWQALVAVAVRRVALREYQVAAALPHGQGRGARMGADWAWGKMPTSALLALHYSFAARYLSHDPGKNLSRVEAVRMSRAGIDLVCVWESTATRARAGFAAGVADAREAWRQAVADGMPAHGVPIYFAVDEDVTGRDVADYFRGVASYLGVHRTGAYGGIRVIAGLFNAGLIAFGWQTYAWSGGQWDKRAQLRQVHNGHRIGGVDSDDDRSVADQFGQWRVA